MTNKKIHFISSVQAKVIFTTILIITLIFGAYAAFDFNQKQRRLEAELAELAEITAVKLVNNLRLPLWDLDSDLVSDTIEAEMLTRDISTIVVFDSDGLNVFSGRQRNGDWETVVATHVATEPNDIRHKAIINNKSERIGHVIVHVTKRFKQDDLYASISNVIATLLVLDLTIFFVLWVVIHNILIRPIKRLNRAAEQISKGRFSADIESSRNDEIGMVAHSIDKMRVSLRIAMQKINRLNAQYATPAKTVGDRNV